MAALVFLEQAGQASESFMTALLAVTFPFNLALGIPLYYGLARWLAG